MRQFKSTNVQTKIDTATEMYNNIDVLAKHYLGIIERPKNNSMEEEYFKTSPKYDVILTSCGNHSNNLAYGGVKE